MGKITTYVVASSFECGCCGICGVSLPDTLNLILKTSTFGSCDDIIIPILFNDYGFPDSPCGGPFFDSWFAVDNQYHVDTGGGPPTGDLRVSNGGQLDADHIGIACVVNPETGKEEFQLVGRGTSSGFGLCLFPSVFQAKPFILEYHDIEFTGAFDCDGDGTYDNPFSPPFPVLDILIEIP